MPDTPTVSVVIPAYNAAWCVCKAIDSVLAQDYGDFEVIVVNDGSTDDTVARLSPYGDAIRVVHQTNRGLSAARNAGIRTSRGKFIAFLDADDWWLPAKLGRQVALLRDRPELGFCSTAALVQGPAGDLVNVWACPNWEGPFLAHLFANNASVAGSGSAVMVRRDKFAEIGHFDESLHSLEDIDMWMRLAAVAGYACLAEPLVVILKRPGSMSRNLDIMRAAAMLVMNKNRHLLPCALQNRFWRQCLASVHGDYAKWRYREGDRWGALKETIALLRLAPIARGRLAAGLLLDIALRRPLS